MAMKRFFFFRGVLFLLCISALCAPSAFAETIYETKDPFGGPYGVWGPYVSVQQSVALRITPKQRYTLDRISLWVMNISGGQRHGKVRLTLRNDRNRAGASVPGNTIYESWTFRVSANGWQPELESVESVLHPVLERGVSYWIVAESDARPHENPVWNYASRGFNFNAFKLCGESWWDGAKRDGLTAVVEGTRAF